MRILVLLSLFAAGSICHCQQLPVNSSSQQPAQVPPQAAPSSQTITVPAGTEIPLTLVSEITNKSARPGNAIRAVTAGAVTVGSQVAIPAGTYVEGAIDSVNKRGSSGPTMQVHFTRIVFAGGYTVSIDANNTQALLTTPETKAAGELDASDISSSNSGTDDESNSASAAGNDPHFSLAAFTPGSEPQFALGAQRGPDQSTGQPPPLHAPGPSFGTVVGISVGATAALIVALVVLNHRGHNTSDALFDTGWQINMVLQRPLTLDAARVADAVASTVAH
jgi:hypothetical protein